MRLEPPISDDNASVPLVVAVVLPAIVAVLIFAVVTHRQRLRTYANGGLHIALGIIIVVMPILTTDGIGWIVAGLIIGPLYASLGFRIVNQGLSRAKTAE